MLSRCAVVRHAYVYGLLLPIIAAWHTDRGPSELRKKMFAPNSPTAVALSSNACTSFTNVPP